LIFLPLQEVFLGLSITKIRKISAKRNCNLRFGQLLQKKQRLPKEAFADIN